MESPLEFFRNRINSHAFRIQILDEAYRSAIVHVLLSLDCVHIFIFKMLCYPSRVIDLQKPFAYSRLATFPIMFSLNQNC